MTKGTALCIHVTGRSCHQFCKFSTSVGNVHTQWWCCTPCQFDASIASARAVGPTSFCIGPLCSLARAAAEQDSSVRMSCYVHVHQTSSLATDLHMTRGRKDRSQRAVLSMLVYTKTYNASPNLEASIEYYRPIEHIRRTHTSAAARAVSRAY
jgi:hypothetical protein